MIDETESIRRIMVPIENAKTDAELPEQTWTTSQLTDDFRVLGFMAPLVGVVRLSDGKKGTLKFRHSPRVYYDFQEG